MAISICAVFLLCASIWMWCDEACANIKWVAELGIVYSIFMIFVGVWG